MKGELVRVKQKKKAAEEAEAEEDARREEQYEYKRVKMLRREEEISNQEKDIRRRLEEHRRQEASDSTRPKCLFRPDWISTKDTRLKPLFTLGRPQQIQKLLRPDWITGDEDDTDEEENTDEENDADGEETTDEEENTDEKEKTIEEENLNEQQHTDVIPHRSEASSTPQQTTRPARTDLAPEMAVLTLEDELKTARPSPIVVPDQDHLLLNNVTIATQSVAQITGTQLSRRREKYRNIIEQRRKPAPKEKAQSFGALQSTGASDGKKSEEIFLLIMSKSFISVTIFSSVPSTSSIEKLVISLAMASARP